MFSIITLPVILTLAASAIALPTAIVSAQVSDNSKTVYDMTRRDVVAPPACAAKAGAARRSAFSDDLSKRIAQTDLTQVAQRWQDACDNSGGNTVTGDPCVQLAGIRGINSLLAGGGVCDQQHVADDMIDFAKSTGIKNKQTLIDIAIAYRQHPRNALNVNGVTPSTPFCQEKPRNSELDGVVNGQLQGVNPGIFGGPKFSFVPFGDPVSCPFGKRPDVATCTCV